MSKYAALAPWQWEPWALLLVFLAAVGYAGLLYQAWQVRPTTARWQWYSPVLFLCDGSSDHVMGSLSRVFSHH